MHDNTIKTSHSGSKSLASIHPLTESEKYKILKVWNDTDRKFNNDGWLHNQFEMQAESHPDNVAIIFKNQQLSCKQLNYRANRLSHFLIHKGVKANVPVSICLDRSIEMIVGILGIMKAGGAYVPIDPEDPIDRINFMVNESGANLLLTTERFLKKLQVNSEIILIDKEIENGNNNNPSVNISKHNAAYMLYTSGSTGRPKLAINTHGGILNRILWMQETFHLSEIDKILQTAPYTFDVSVGEFFWPLLTGATLVVAEPNAHKDPVYIANIIQSHKITIIQFVPAMLELFLSDIDKDKCRSLRYIICGGETLTKTLHDHFFSILSTELYNSYGPTEAAIAVTYFRCDKNRPIETVGVSIGRPIANTKIYILNSHLDLLPEGVPGELYIGGVQVGLGYHNQPKLTKEKFIPNPFDSAHDSRLYRTGDLAKWQPDGNIEFLGRIDHQVKIRGFRIELGEIESTLSEHPSIRQAIVLARKNKEKNQFLSGYIVFEERRPLGIFEIRSYLEQFLPDYMIPANFIYLEKFPLTPNGKIDRKRLLEINNVEMGLDYQAPQTNLQRRLCEIWKNILPANRIGVNDNFFVLGGHSLLVPELIRQISDEIGVKISFASMYENMTIAELAREIKLIKKTSPNEIESNHMNDSRSLENILTLQSGNSNYFSPIFFLHPPIGSIGYLINLVKHLNPDQPCFGIQSPAFNGVSEPFDDMGKMVTSYLKGVRSVQPDGSFMFIGHSSGAFIAYEMALQFQNEGLKVPLFVTIDEPAPSFGEQTENPLMELFKQENLGDSPEALYFTAWAVGLAHSKELPFSLNQLCEVAKAERYDLVTNFLKTAGFIPENANNKMVDMILKMYANHSTAEENYRKSLRNESTKLKYKGHSVLIRCTEDTTYEGFGITEAADTSECAGWDEFCEGPIDVIGVPGANHITMIIEPYVKIMAEKLQPYLDRFAKK